MSNKSTTVISLNAVSSTGAGSSIEDSSLTLYTVLGYGTGTGSANVSIQALGSDSTWRNLSPSNFSLSVNVSPTASATLFQFSGPFLGIRANATFVPGGGTVTVEITAI